MHRSYPSIVIIRVTLFPSIELQMPLWSKSRTSNPQKPAKITAKVPDPLSLEEEQWIVCRKCQSQITRPSERTMVNGAHQHTFANPSGIVFEIGCFLKVRNCTLVGHPSTDFPWFTGHSWQITVCAGCLTHLGWMFSNQQGQQFYGLIIDRITVVSSI